MSNSPYTISEVETEIHVTIDWSQLTYGDAVALQKTVGDPEAATAALEPLISKLIGQPAAGLPMGLMMEIAQRITVKLAGDAPAKN